MQGGEPVVILGGGLAGLTAAYRLSQAGIPCEVYEAAARLGGRVFTKDQFNAEGMFCELGGEFIDTTQKEILELAAELGVPIDDFLPEMRALPPHLFHFGGKIYREADILREFAPMAEHLKRDAAKVFLDGSSPIVTYDRHGPEAKRFDRISLEQYLQSKRNDVAGWVLDAIHAAYVGEFGLDAAEQSSINLLVLLSPEMPRGPDGNPEFRIFGESDESKRIRGGNTRLIEALGRAIEPRVKVHLEHRWRAIRGSGADLELTFLKAGTVVTRKAKQVICAVPFTMVREIEGIDQLGLSPTKLQCIRELGYGTNSKYMQGFKERYWRQPHGDTPASLGYVFTDQPSQCFWDSSVAQKGASGIMTNFTGGSTGRKGIAGGMAALLAHLEKIHPGIGQASDGNKVLFNWSQYGYARGSYACPRVGQYTTIMGAAKTPELGGRLLFAGEHVSEHYQGYMNGAVQSGNQAARALQ